VSVRPFRTDPDVGIPDLLRRLGDDSKRLVSDEMRLAKLEMRESMHSAARGSMWLGIAFGIGVVALTAFTVLLATALGRAFGGNYWAGALIAGALELTAAALLIKRGVSMFTETDYTLEETREEAKRTAQWVSSEAKSNHHDVPVAARSVEVEHRPTM
jgi:uncharacterized membrane protein YqjE